MALDKVILDEMARIYKWARKQQSQQNYLCTQEKI